MVKAVGQADSPWVRDTVGKQGRPTRGSKSPNSCLVRDTESLQGWAKNTKERSMQSPVYAGIDVSQEWLDGALTSSTMGKRWANDETGIAEAVRSEERRV